MIKLIYKLPPPAVLAVAAVLLASGETAFSQELSTNGAAAANPGVASEADVGGRRIENALKFAPDLNTKGAGASAQTFFTLRRQSDAGRNANHQAVQNSNSFTPLTPEEKLKYGLRSAFLNPFSYAITAVNAAITTASEEDQPQKSTEDRIADGFSRFAISFGTRSAKSLLGSGVYPAIFKQDPRYRPSGKQGFGPRALYAASRVFVTHGDSGNLQPNFSRLGGTLSASALANIYERSTPGRDRIGVGPTFKRFGTSIGLDVIQFVVFREFGSDIKKIINFARSKLRGIKRLAKLAAHGRA